MDGFDDWNFCAHFILDCGDVNLTVTKWNIIIHLENIESRVGDPYLSSVERHRREADEIARAMLKAKGIIAVKLEQQADEVDRRYQALTARTMELQEALAFEMKDCRM